MSDNFLGQSIQNMIDQTDSDFSHGLRRTDDGELFIAKVDPIKKLMIVYKLTKKVILQRTTKTFQQGEDFPEGRDVNMQEFIRIKL